MRVGPRLGAIASEDTANHNRVQMYVLGAAALGVVLVIAKVPPAGILPFGLLLLVCPLMMIFMMKGMAGKDSKKEDHSGHDCEHDPTGMADKSARNDPADHRVA